MNIRKLKARMALEGVNGDTLAKAMGISESTFYRRMNADKPGEDFSQGEIEGAIKALHLVPSDVMEIFFSSAVS